MNKNIVAAVVLFALSAGSAQANKTIDGVHESTNINTSESYFIKATSAGNADFFLQSEIDTTGNDIFFNSLLSVWQQIGSNWVLVGANDDAPRILTVDPATSGSTSIYGQTVNGYNPGDAGSGLADAGLTMSLVANATYMIVQSEARNGPTSLSLNGILAANNAAILTGSLGQTIAIGSPLASALWGMADLSGGAGEAYSILNPYKLHINGNILETTAPSAVPLPAAVWLFGSALTGLGLFGRKKAGRQLVV